MFIGIESPRVSDSGGVDEVFVLGAVEDFDIVF